MTIAEEGFAISRPTPGLLRIIQTDYWAFLGALAPVIGWIVYAVAVSGLYKAERSDTFLWIALGFTGIGLPALVWRLSLIRGVFANGEEVPGVITSVGFYRDRGRAEFAYQFREEHLASSNALHKSAGARALVAGQQVTLVVDPQSPRRAFIRHLFLED